MVCVTAMIFTKGLDFSTTPMMAVWALFSTVLLLHGIVDAVCPEWRALSEKVSKSDGIRVNLTTALNSDGAACLDGSVPVMYYRAGTGDGVHKFHVYFEGGGWCGGIDIQQSSCQDTCVHRSTTHLGSSTTYPDAADFDNQYMSTDPDSNPLSHNWNTIYVKYCDGMAIHMYPDDIFCLSFFVYP